MVSAGRLIDHLTSDVELLTCRLQAKTVATAAAAVAGFHDNEIDLAFARYRANTDGKRSQFRVLLARPAAGLFFFILSPMLLSF